MTSNGIPANFLAQVRYHAERAGYDVREDSRGGDRLLVERAGTTVFVVNPGNGDGPHIWARATTEEALREVAGWPDKEQAAATDDLNRMRAELSRGQSRELWEVRLITACGAERWVTVDGKPPSDWEVPLVFPPLRPYELRSEATARDVVVHERVFSLAEFDRYGRRMTYRERYNLGPTLPPPPPPKPLERPRGELTRKNGWLLLSMHDASGRRGVWYRKEGDRLEVCAGREGDDFYWLAVKGEDAEYDRLLNLCETMRLVMDCHLDENDTKEWRRIKSWLGEEAE